MNDRPLTFFCDKCGNLKLVAERVDGTEKCLRCHNDQVERNLRRMRSPSAEEIPRKRRPNFHDD